MDDIATFIAANITPQQNQQHKLENYMLLNSIVKKKIKLPYSIPSIEVVPTFKTFQMKYADKKYFMPVPFTKGGSPPLGEVYNFFY
jgi:hypothetical protein